MATQPKKINLDEIVLEKGAHKPNAAAASAAWWAAVARWAAAAADLLCDLRMRLAQTELELERETLNLIKRSCILLALSAPAGGQSGTRPRTNMSQTLREPKRNERHSH